MGQDGPGHGLGLCVGSFGLGPVILPVDGAVVGVEYGVVVVVCVGVYIGADALVDAVVVDAGVLAGVVVLVGAGAFTSGVVAAAVVVAGGA